MDIVSAMDEIGTRLGALAITSPLPQTVVRVWDPLPPDSVMLADFPCWGLSLTFLGADRTASQYIERYSLRMQLFLNDADRDRGLKIARAFHVALLAAFAPHPTLSATVTDQTIRGGAPTEGILTRNNVSFAGLDEYMDITIKNAMTYDTA